MAIIGMDIEGVRQLAAMMDSMAADLERVPSMLSVTLNETSWLGPDRERFIGDWMNEHEPNLIAAASFLRQASTAARSNADNQEAASA